MKAFLIVIAMLTVVIAIGYIGNQLQRQQKDIERLEKAVKLIDKQYYNLYNSHNYVIRQIEDMKQF